MSVPGHVIQGRDDYSTEYASFIIYQLAMPYQTARTSGASVDTPAIRQALDPVRFIAARTLRGGPAPSESERQARLFADALAGDERIVADIEARLAEAAAKLDAAVDTIIGRNA